MGPMQFFGEISEGYIRGSECAACGRTTVLGRLSNSCTESSLKACAHHSDCSEWASDMSFSILSFGLPWDWLS
jgi:hypothetical protein